MKKTKEEIIKEEEDTKYNTWVSIIQKYPEIYSKQTSGLLYIPKKFLERLADKFDFVRIYVNGE